MIELERLPELVDPVLIAAFEGWNDAGEASSGVIAHLESAWKAEPLIALDPDDYYDFQVTRPVVEMGEGLTRSIVWPTTRLLRARPPGVERDVVLLRGIEPNMRWRSFCADIIEICRELGIELAVMLGALLNDSPHTRPVPILGGATDEALARSTNLELSRYEGPTGIVGVLQHAFGEAGLDAISLWASVPHYVAQPPNPKATLALLRRLEDVLEIPMPWASSTRRPARGSAASTSWPRRTARSPSTSRSWRSARTPPSCPRPAATRSRPSSSATCAAGTGTLTANPQG